MRTLVLMIAMLASAQLPAFGKTWDGLQPGDRAKVLDGQLVTLPIENGVRVFAAIGSISPKKAAAVWWDLPAQAAELFPGTQISFLSGDESEFGFVASILAGLPDGSSFSQVARYTAGRDGSVIWIKVDAFEENVLWSHGLGKYEFYKAGLGKTILEITSQYDAKIPLEVLNAAAVGAAQAHQARYLSGRKPTAQERKDFRSAIR